jgi:citrate lyase subunit beta/citryl-CoA lyase
MLEIATARTMLFVPGDRPDRFERAASAGADVLILDLEDAVAPEHKQAGRSNVRRWIGAGGRAAVRVNGIGTPWFAADVEAVGASAIVLPKCSSAADVQLVRAMAAAETDVVALVESAAGVANIREISAAPGVARVAFGHIDFSAEICVDPSSRPALAAARSAIVYACAEARLPAPVDGVTTAISDEERLADDCEYARGLGFGAKLCIHPGQILVAARLMGPTPEELSWARSIIEAPTDEGVTVLAGHMIDEPVIARARRLLASSPRRTPDPV